MAVAIALKLGGVAVFVIMDSLIKATSGHVPPWEAVFFRSFFAIPLILGWLAMRGDLATGLRAQRPLAHVWRGLIGTSGMALGFAALGLLPLPEVIAIGFAAPLITVILAALLLGERIRLFRITAVAIGLVGVLIVLAPRLTFFGEDAASEAGRLAALGALIMLCGACFKALAFIHIRKMVQTEQASARVFWFSVTATVLSLLTVPFGWTMPPLWAFALLVLAGLLGGTGQILMTSSYRFADASVLAPFDYASLLFALGIGYFVFAEVPTVTMLSGAAVVIAAGVLIIWRERQLGIRRRGARANITPMG